MRIGCLLISLGLMAFTSRAQFDLSHRQITVKNGLKSNTIFDIQQGADGSIIVAHNAGLSRYNGIQIEHYTQPLKNTTLSNILEIHPKTYLSRNFNDEVFITERKALIKIDTLSVKKTGFSTFFKLDETIFYKKGGEINRVWFDNGLKIEPVFTASTDVNLHSTCTANKVIYANQGDSIYCIYPFSQKQHNVVFARSGNYKFLFTKNDKAFLFIPEFNSIYSIENDHLKKRHVLSHLHPENKVNFIQTLKNNYLVVGTFAGLYIYDQNFNYIGTYLQDSQISCLTEDLEGNLWIGSLQDGIFIAPSLKIKALTSTKLFSEKTNMYSSIVVHDTNLVIGTYNGKIGKLNKEGELIAQVDLNQVAEVQSLFYDEKQNELLAFCSKLFVIDFETFKIKKTQECQSTKSIIKDGDKTYCGASQGLVIFKDGENQKHHNPELWITKMTTFENGILLETASGLQFYDKKTETIGDFTPLQSLGPMPPISNCILLNDTLYFALGPAVMTLIDSKIETLFEIPNNNIKTLTIVNGVIYASNGAEIYAFQNKTVSCINQYKGLQLTGISQLEAFNGHLLARNNTELAYFEGFVEPNKIRPIVTLCGVGGTFSKAKNKWKSEYDQNELELKFEVLPNISALGTSKIHYQLTGQMVQNGSIDLQITNLLSLQRLPAGDYQLSVKAVNEDGLFSDDLLFQLVVLQPYYTAWWFIALMILLLVVLVFLVIKWRIGIISRKNKEKIKKERLKIKALNAELNAIRAQMNPHFIFNCLSSIQTKILNDDSKNAYENLSVFTKLLREALLFTSKEFISLEDEISFIKKYVHLEQMRREGAFEFELNIEEGLNLSAIKFPSLITQPIVENAILHGLMHQEGNNLLTFSVHGNSESGYLSIEIADNGIGIKKSLEKNLSNRKNHVSFGGQALKDRVELLQKSNYRLSIQTLDLEKGTKVILTIPNKKYD